MEMTAAAVTHRQPLPEYSRDTADGVHATAGRHDREGTGLMWRAIGALGPLIAAAILRTDRRIQSELLLAQAVSADRAAAIDARSALKRWRLNRLTGVGAVHAVENARYYWDEAGWQRYRRQRRRRALSILGVLLVAIAFLWWRGELG
jgi:hypothetical protein